MSPLKSSPEQLQGHRIRPLRRFRSLRCPNCKHFLGAALLLALVIAAGQPTWAQTWVSAIGATTTGSTAKVTWSTAVPADSQVEYGTTAAYGTVTVLAAAKVAAHSVAITGLTGGTTYHFRVRSSDSSGALVLGPDYSLTISLPISVTLSPLSATVAANGTQQFTATVANDSNQAVTWSATAGTISSTGMFTAPSVSATTPVTVTATSQADSTKTASVTLQIGSAQGANSMLLGHATIETAINGLPAGLAEGYQITAATTGSLTSLSFYLDAATTATKMFVGLYSDNNGHPGTLLTSSSSATLQKSTWNNIPVPPASVSAGSKYWFALLGTGGTLRFRWKPGTGGWIDELSSLRTLTALPPTWTTGTIYSAGALTSVYGSGVSSGGVANTTAVLAVSPAGLSWTAKVGTSTLAPGSVSVNNTGTGSLTFSGVSDQPWLAISSGTGTAPATVQILPSTTGLAAGTYTGHVTLSGGGASKTVTVILSMTAPAPVQHTVSLSWKTPTAGTVVSYNMYRSTIHGASYGLVASAIGGTSFTDPSPLSGTLYYYVVTAVDSQGRESIYSNEIKATIP